MKKIMFNDKYGLTKAVLEGRKTQTRRIAYDFRKHTSNKVTKCVILPSGYITYMDGKIQVLDVVPHPSYKVGEEVAIAQSYSNVFHIVDENKRAIIDKINCTNKGWSNKMFVRADLMPHRIRITNVRVERLQDICEEDCLKEGIEFARGCYYTNYNKQTNSRTWLGNTPKEAFATLIDKTCGRGTWDSNPYVFVYDFKLIK